YQSEMRTQHFAVHQRLDDTLTALLEVETGARGYALSGSEEYLAPYERGRKSLMGDLETLRGLTAHEPAQERLLTTLAGLVRQRLAVAERLAETRRSGGLRAAQRVVVSGIGKRVMNDARQVLARMSAREDALLVKGEAATRHDTLLTVILTTAALVMALSLFLAAFALYHREQRRREALEVELVRARDAAEAANRAKSEFLANTSHEVRTPMNAIIGMTDLVLETPLSADQKRFLGTVREAAASLLALLNDLLDFAKMEAGRLDLEHTPFALREVVEGTTRMMAERAHSKGLELACGLAPEVPDALAGDPGRLRQVLVNLLGNAIKFTAHGEVVVRVEVEEEREHDVTLRFSVTDTGIGIPPDKLGLIFDPFRQADQSVTRAYGGTGLGLAISAQLAARMQGRLWAESEVGKGSVFHFAARFEVADETTQPLPARPESLKDMRVLVVDDNAANRLIYGELITAWAMRPTVAEGGAEALTAVEEALATGDPFTLALLDVRMPAMDGYQLAERLRGRPESGDLAILMLSSDGDLGDAERRRELGIAACLAKPVRRSELLDSIMRAMGVANGDERAAEESAPIVRPLRVLLAEDHCVNQELVARLLTKRGHTVTVASNGREAVDHLCTDEFDVVLMDLQMPVMDGLAATAAIRDPRSPVRRHDVPIVAMTAHAMKGDRDRCLAAGMDAYVPKPISASALMGALADLLGAEPPRQAPRQAGGPPERPPASAESADHPDLFDLAAVLGRMEGDEAVAKRVARMFLADLPALLAGIEEAAEASDAEALALNAHTLKGSAATLGGRRAQEASLHLETVARAGDVRAARGMLEDVKREVDALEQAVREFVRAEGADGDEA
ncbi:MAG: response regulator, partial [Thermoleophilia bacterium]